GRFQFSGEATLSDYLRLEEAVQVGETGDVDDDLISLLLSAADEAAGQVLKMRKSEGGSLSNELDSYINLLEDLVKKTEDHAPLVLETYTERLRNKLKEVMQE